MRLRSKPAILPLLGGLTVAVAVFLDLAGYEGSWPLLWVGVALVIAGAFLTADEDH